MIRTTIRDHQEEGACTWCGAPLYVGDSGWLTDAGKLVCSRSCADDLARSYGEARRQDRRRRGGLD